MTEATSRGGIVFVMPALNEAATIAAVVNSVLPFGQAIVVDDGSTDGTGAIARAAGATVLRHGHRMGYDAGISDGLRHAADAGFDWAVTLDADGQHAQDNLPRVVQSLAADVDLVVGIRPSRARWSERVMAWFFERRWGIRDPLCGLKAYRLGRYRDRHMQGGTYDSIGTEIMLQYLRSGARVTQIPIAVLPRADAPRFGNRLSANARIFAALVLSFLKSRSPVP